MQKFFIGFGIFVVAAGIALLEYGLFPNRVTPLSPQASEHTTGEKPFHETEVVRFDLPLTQISEKNFEIAGIPDVKLDTSYAINHLFGKIILRQQSDNIHVLRSNFTHGDTVLVSIYEIFVTQKTTSSKAFTYIQQKLEEKYANNPETQINQTDSFGLHSFYLNSEDAPDKVFLVVITPEKILGFEYLKENHETLIPLFSQLVPKLEE